MSTELSEAGIGGLVGDLPWGTHFCHFYETQADLLDTLVPYFQAGLENNEFCLWILSPPLTATDAMDALRRVVPAIGQHLSAGDIKFVSYHDRYPRSGEFSLPEMISGWKKQVDEAMAKGYSGVRVTGNLAWEDHNGWTNLNEYERAVDDSIRGLRLTALCTYALGNCGATQVLDVVCTHQFALARRKGKLEVVETSETKRAKAEVQRLNRELEDRVIERTEQLADANKQLQEEFAERMRVEEVLRESENLRRMIIEAEPECVKLLARDGTLLEMNPAGLAMIEADSREQVIGQSVFSLLPQEWHATFRELSDKVFRGETVVVEFEMVGMKGTHRWMESHAAPLRNKDFEVTAQLAVTRDVTERKRAEAALKESEQRFAAFMDNLPGFAWIKNADGAYVYVNDELRKIFPNHQDDWSGKSDADIWPAEIAAGFQRNDQRVLKTRRELQTIETWTHDGQTRYSLVTKFPIQNAQGETIMIAGAGVDITERKQAEEALRVAEKKYRHIFENAGEGIFQTTEEGRFLTANPALAQMLGYHSAEDLIDDRIDIENQHYVDPMRRQEFKRLVESNGFIRDFEYEAYKKDGSKLWITTNVRAVRDEAGTLLYYEGTAQDITDRKDAEIDLIKQKEILEKIVEQIPVMINFGDSEGRIKLVNREWQKTLGWSLEEVLNDGVDVLAETYPSAKDYQEVLTFRKAADGEWADFKTRVKDGTVIDTSWARVKLSDGTTIGIGQNITERKRAEEAMREAEQKYRELFENAKDATYVHDLAGRYTSINPAAEALSGYSRDEILGRPFTDFLAPEHRGPAGENLCRKLREEGETTYEAEVITKDGRRVPVEINSRLIRKNGVLLGVQGTARDITERKRAQEAMRSYSRRLIEAQETERQSIARELHDEIGQVLTAVRINLQSAQRSSGTEAYLLRIEDSIVVVDEALKRVRELSLQLRPSLLDDLGLTAALRWYADRYALRTGFTVQVLSDCETVRLRRELETACFRITQEALTNIARYTEATRVLVELRRAEGMLTLVIKDDGPGFDVDALFRNASAGEALGLRGMEERALAVEGRFEINSEPGQGTEVRVTFPLTRKS
jgi:PAS domain S-box-containing protein